jgi:membrane associated rhomboid family serine protease
VDCVRQQAKTMRSATTVFGGRVADRPVVSMTIVAICVAVWLGQQAVPGLTQRVGFEPGLAQVEPWRFVTAAFAHHPSMVLHIVFNMLALWIVGAQYLEPLLGRLRFAALYLVSAVGGSVAYLLLSSPPQVAFAPPYTGQWGGITVGASGAVFGLFGALLVLNRRLGRSSAGMYATLVINAVIGFVVPSIAWEAHLGGFLTGAAVAAVFAYANSRTTRRWQWPGIGGIAGILVVASLLRYAAAAGLA